MEVPAKRHQQFAHHVRGSQSCPWTLASGSLGVCVCVRFILLAPLPALREGSADSQFRKSRTSSVSRATLVPSLASPSPLSDHVAGQLLTLVELLFSHLWMRKLALQCCPADTRGKARGTEPDIRLTFEMEANC